MRWDVHVLTHCASLEFIAVGADLDHGTGSRVQRGEFSALRALLSSMARSVGSLGHCGLSSVFEGCLPKELVINFAQSARHVADVAVLYVDDDRVDI